MKKSIRGGIWISALVLILLMVFFTGVGYGIGRYLIGEQYLKQGAVDIRARERPQPESRSSFVPPPVAGGTWESSRGELGGEDWLPEGQGGARVKVEEAPDFVSREREPSGLSEGEPDRTERPPRRGERYTIQVGVFLDEHNTQSLVDDLNNRGYRAHVERVDDAHGTIYRVVTGDFSSERAAEKRAERLMNEGYTGAFVAPQPEGGGESDESTSGNSESR